jgi:prepilin-type N-terminal cleavage/methylation domain-containing protein
MSDRLQAKTTDARRGATLVELLTVIAIIGVLIALLLPAVQFCREAARQSACRNHLRQIALAMHAHEAQFQHLPAGGWGWRWHGDPDRGFDARQPGGWVYGALPFLEQQSLRSVGEGLAGPQKALALSQGASVPVATFHCPSRRSAQAFAYVSGVNYVNMTRPELVARSDYAACSGDINPVVAAGRGRGPTSLTEGDSPTYVWLDTDRSGIVFRRSTVRLAMITDGLSNTYLVGEKHVDAKEYFSGAPQNDDQSLLVGFDSDTLRTTDPAARPRRDIQSTSDHAFGSAHPSGFFAAMCDASVHFVGYDVDSQVHRTRGNRHDGVTAAGP